MPCQLIDMVGSKLTAVRRLGDYTFLVFDRVTDNMYCVEEQKFWAYEWVAEHLRECHISVRHRVRRNRAYKLAQVIRTFERAIGVELGGGA